MLRAEPDGDAALRAGVVVRVDDVQCRARYDVRTPGLLRRKLVGKLEVDRDDLGVASDADLDVRPEVDVLRERLRLDVPPEIELIGIERGADPDAGRYLRSGGHREKHEE